VRSDGERLGDMLDAIERIQRVTVQGRAAFDADELAQTWVVHHVQIIGEAARALSEALRARHPQIPWQVIIRMRHVLVHDYFGIDLEEVWSVVENDLASLQAQLESVVAQE
jgi:uncharacterized protein with HEPN domain